MELTVYHLKNCDTCKKAIKALEAAGHSLTLTDVRADGVPSHTLANIADRVGWETLLNTRSTTWRGLAESEKADVNQAMAIELMSQHPTLIKRPVIVSDDTITVGWTAQSQANWLLR